MPKTCLHNHNSYRQSEPANTHRHANLTHLGIITALLPEARCFDTQAVIKQPKRISNELSLIVSGMGQSAAEIATRKLLDFGANSLLVIGTCGALSPLLKPGEIVLPETVMTDTQVTMQPTASWHHRVHTLLSGLAIPIHTQTLLSIGRVLSRTKKKNQIHLDTGAIAVDMESAAIIKVAQSKQVPVLILRTVIDPSDFSIPDFVLKNSDDYGDMHIYSLLKSCIFNPLRLGSLFRLAGYYSKAKSTLMKISVRLDLLEPTTI